MKYVRSAFFALITCLTAVSAWANPPKDLNRALKEFDAYTRKTLQEWNVPGAAVAVVWNNRTIYMQGFGKREVSKPEIVDEHTLFRLGSLSKPFASGLAAILQERGVIDLDDRVVDYLPDFKLQKDEYTQKLTLRHVLSHTSGLFCPYAYDNLLEGNLPYPKIVKRLKEVDLSNPPGKKFAYQNILYSVIGDVTQVATNETFENSLRNNVFLPLRMYDSSANAESYLRAENKAIPHVQEGDFAWKAAPLASPYYQVAPAGGINSSLANMTSWLHAQLGTFPEAFPPSVLSEVHSKQIKISMPKELSKIPELAESRVSETAYGLGWKLAEYNKEPIIYHGGRLKGFSNVMALMPNEKIGIVILTNAETPVPYILMSKFFDLYKELPSQDWSTITLASYGKKPHTRVESIAKNVTRKKLHSNRAL